MSKSCGSCKNYMGNGKCKYGYKSGEYSSENPCWEEIVKKDVSVSNTMPLEEIINELCGWIETNNFGLSIRFYYWKAGAYFDIKLAKELSLDKTFTRKKSFYIVGGAITKEHFNFNKKDVADWVEEVKKEYIKKEFGIDGILRDAEIKLIFRNTIILIFNDGSISQIEDKNLAQKFRKGESIDVVITSTVIGDRVVAIKDKNSDDWFRI